MTLLNVSDVVIGATLYVNGLVLLSPGSSGGINARSAAEDEDGDTGGGTGTAEAAGRGPSSALPLLPKDSRSRSRSHSSNTFVTKLQDVCCRVLALPLGVDADHVEQSPAVQRARRALVSLRAYSFVLAVWNAAFSVLLLFVFRE